MQISCSSIRPLKFFSPTFRVTLKFLSFTLNKKIARDRRVKGPRLKYGPSASPPPNGLILHSKRRRFRVHVCDGGSAYKKYYARDEIGEKWKNYLQRHSAAALFLLSETDRGNALTERPQSSRRLRRPYTYTYPADSDWFFLFIIIIIICFVFIFFFFGFLLLACLGSLFTPTPRITFATIVGNRQLKCKKITLTILSINQKHEQNCNNLLLFLQNLMV